MRHREIGDGLPVRIGLPARGRPGRGEPRRVRRAAGSDQAADADDLARPDLEGNVAHLRGAGEPADLEEDVAGRAGRARMLLLMIALMLAGLGLTTLRPLVCVIVGIATVTFGFAIVST